MDKFLETASTIALGIIGVAMVAVIVSRNAQTPAVIQASGSAFGNSLAVAEAPVTGDQTPINLSYPGQGFGSFLPSLNMPTW
ncbi:MAG: hypothetical protein KGL39_46645 [Patescibacteria group bacterium]|nr:hypothetical protein [Patescibacteria group bacterium]